MKLLYCPHCFYRIPGDMTDSGCAPTCPKCTHYGFHYIEGNEDAVAAEFARIEIEEAPVPLKWSPEKCATHIEEAENFILWAKEHHPDVVIGKDSQGDQMLMGLWRAKDAERPR